MDSFTQATLGAAVTGAILEPKVGRRALLWGAFLGTLPDLDSLLPLGDAVRTFTYHRGFSHSVVVITLLTPLCTWLMTTLHRDMRECWNRCLVAVYFCFVTHVLLDAMTIYGTQLFWPLSTPPVGRGNIFIIDPAYTLPLLIGVLALAMMRRRRLAWTLNAMGLLVSGLYLAFTLVAQHHVSRIAHHEISRQNIPARQVLVQPTPFNAILWRVLVMEEGGYREGFYSLLDERPTIEFVAHDSSNELLAGLEEAWAVQRLRWFTKGFYRARRVDNEVVMTDLRMGGEPNYVFSFVVGKKEGGGMVEVPNRYLRQDRPELRDLKAVWNRLKGRRATGP